MNFIVMKKRYGTMTRVAASILMTAVLTGCSLFSPKKTDKEEPILPHDREIITNTPDLKTYTPDEIRKGVVKGDWSIQEVYDKTAVGEKAPFLKFVPATKRVYGNNGCNVINAEYQYSQSDSTMRFDNIASTMMICATPGITDTQINTALSATRYYTWSVADSDYFLYLYDSTHRRVMTLMHQNFDFLNGTWLVTAIENKTINVPSMKLVIDVDEGKLHGNTGCNVINGRLDINMDQANSISFSAIGMTRMACPEPNYETALVVALEEACAARPVSASEIILSDGSGKQVLSLKRTTDK